MPGCGKSSIGRLVAHHLNLPFFDLDRLIEDETGTTISNIFSNQGESYFRKLESSQLQHFVLEHPEFLLATGGGTPCFDNNISFMNQEGITVFIDAPKELLLERIKRKTHRPLLKNDPEEKLNELLKQRIPIYERAELQFKRGEETKDQFAIAVAESLRQC